MKRISTATRVLNKFGAGKDGYTDGDVIGGVPATDLEAALFDNVQEEIASVIEAAGIALNGGVYNQLLLALRAAGVLTTPAQFDNTTKAATTAFVKAQGLQGSGLTTITTSAAIGLSAVGGTVFFNAAGAIAPTLPAANTVPAGARIECFNINTGAATVTRTGADTIKVNSTTVTALPVGGGDTLTLESDGVSIWYAVGGSVQLKYASVFGSSPAVAGYQKLPSGLIIQWGLSASLAQGANSIVTLPIAFPTAHVVSLATPGIGSSLLGSSAGSLAYSASQIQVWNVSGSAQSFAVYWLAIGY